MFEGYADEDLVRRAQRGLQDTFDEIIRRYQQRVLNLCFRLLGNEEEAKDVSIEIFLNLHRHLKHFRFESKFSTWVYRIAANAAYRFLKKRKLASAALVQHAETKSSSSQQSSGGTHRDVLIQRELSERVRLTLRQLPEKFAEVLILYEIEGLSYEEIAQAAGVPLGTVMSRLSRAKRSFAEAWSRSEQVSP